MERSFGFANAKISCELCEERGATQRRSAREHARKLTGVGRAYVYETKYLSHKWIQRSNLVMKDSSTMQDINEILCARSNNFVQRSNETEVPTGLINSKVVTSRYHATKRQSTIATITTSRSPRAQRSGTIHQHHLQQ